jgi:hypothetical protein
MVVQIWIFFEIRLRVFLKNSEIFLKKGKNLSKWVWVSGRELKFGINMRCLMKNKNGYSNLELFEIRMSFSEKLWNFLGKRSKISLSRSG